MKRIFGPLSVILVLFIATPENAIAAARLSTSKISFCSILVPTMTGQSKIFFGSRKKYRGKTVSTFHSVVGGVSRLLNVQNSGWALDTRTEYAAPGVLGADLIIQSAHIYQRKTCGFWEDWIERSTAQSGCGTYIAIPS